MFGPVSGHIPLLGVAGADDSDKGDSGVSSAVCGRFYRDRFQEGGPRTVGLIQPLLLLLTIGASALARFWLGGLPKSPQALRRCRVCATYGAGTARAAACRRDGEQVRDAPVVGFLDDDDHLHGHVLNHRRCIRRTICPIWSNPLGLAMSCWRWPQIGSAATILAQMLDARVSVRTLPRDRAGARKDQRSDIHKLDVNDLLGSRPVAPNHILLGKNIAKNNMVTTRRGRFQ